MSNSTCPHCGWTSTPALDSTAKPPLCPRCNRSLAEAAAPVDSPAGAPGTDVPWYILASGQAPEPPAEPTEPATPKSRVASAKPPATGGTQKPRERASGAKPKGSQVRPAVGPERAAGAERETRAPAQQSPPEPPPAKEIPPEPLPLDDLPEPADPRRSAKKARQPDQQKPKSDRTKLEDRTDPAPPSGRGKKIALLGAAIFSVVAVAAVGIGFLARGFLKNDPQKPDPTPVADDGGAGTPYTFKPEEIAERLIPSTVLVSPDKTINSLGSGVLINRDPHVVLTNWHVVEDARNKNVFVFFPDRDARRQVISQVTHYRNKADVLGIPAKIIHADRDRDIAMLELSRVPDTAVPVSLAAGSAKQLEHVYGNGQSGVDFSALWQSNEGSCRQVVDFPFAEGNPGTSRVLLTSQPVNPGDSGGPVVNAQLELVGIVRAKANKYLRVLEKKVKIEGLDNFSLVVDVEELRAHLNDGFRFAYKRSFPEPSNQFAREAGASGSPARPKPKPRTPEELVHVLSFGTSEQAPQAIRELREAGTAAVPFLINMLRDDAQRGNWPKALEALERIDNPAAAAPAVEVAIRCLKDDEKKTKIETKIAAAKFLRAVNPYGKEDALPVLWQALAVNHSRLRIEVRETVRTYGPYSKKDLETLKKMAGLVGMEDPAKRRAVNPFVKAFFVVLLLGMEDLSQAEVTDQVNYLQLFVDADPRLRTFIAELLIDEPEKLSRRNRLQFYIPLLGDSAEGTSKKAREALEDMTWQFGQDIMYKEFKDGDRSSDGSTWKRADGKYVVTLNRARCVNNDGTHLVDKEGQPIFFPFGYTLANKNELAVITIDGFVPAGKDSRERAAHSVKASKLRKLTEEDVETLVQILQDPSTPTDGLIYALDLLLSKGALAHLQIARIAPLLSEKTNGNDKDRNLTVIFRVLLLIIAQNKPLDIGGEVMRLCDHAQKNIRSTALLCLPLIHDPNRMYEKEILKILYESLEDDDSEIRSKARLAMEACLQVREDRFVNELSQSQAAMATARQADKRAMAAKALSHLGKKAETATQALLAALDDKDIEVQMYAAQALGKIGGPAVAAGGGKKIGALLLHDLDTDIANPKRENFKRNFQIRGVALDALVSLKEDGRDALPALAEYATKFALMEKMVSAEAGGITQEHLLLSLKAIRGIVQEPSVKCDDAVVIRLVNLFQRDVLEGGDRSLVSSAVLDTLRQMGARALPALTAFLQSKKKRASPSTDAIPLTGAMEAVVAIFPSEGLVLDGQLRKRLSTTLVELRDEYKNWRRMLQGRPGVDVAVFDRMLSRIDEAFRLVNKFPPTKN